MGSNDQAMTPNDSKNADDSMSKGSQLGHSTQMGLKGQKIGHYRLIQELGHGAQGYVYLADDENLHRQVALKILIGGGHSSASAKLRFDREAETASKLDHSGIARVFEVGEYEGLRFIAFELIQGKTLQEHISETAQEAADNRDIIEIHLDFEENGHPDKKTSSNRSTSSPSGSADRDAIMGAVRYIESTARALHAAHEVGLIHRDIKPGNLMVRADGTACVLDFGLAKDEESVEMTLTQSGDLMGTPAYMSPEQLLAHRLKLDRRTDIYSLGVTLFEACTLRRPFQGGNRQELYEAISQKEPPHPRSINPKIPKDLAAIILTSMDKSRDRRYPTALEFAQDLRRFREYEPVQARPAGVLVKTMRWVQRNPRVALMGLIAFLALSVASAVFYFKGEEAKNARDDALLSKTEAEKATKLAKEESTQKSIALAREKAALQEKSQALAAETKEREAKQAALDEKAKALADVERLADVKKVQEAAAATAVLWPARPKKIQDMKAWLEKYRVLSQSLSGHRSSLVALRSEALPYSEEDRLRDHEDDLKKIGAATKSIKEAETKLTKESEEAAKTKIKESIAKAQQAIADLKTKTIEQASWDFGQEEVKQWKHDVLAELVRDLEKFCAEKSGTYADVQSRLRAAQTIEQKTIDDHRTLWDETIAAIQASKKYDGLLLKPQLGLIPLGQDPQSKLFEFLHLETHEGALPKRNQEGKIPMEENTGIILVLIPKGKFWMGSQKTDPKGQNFDSQLPPDVKLREVPIEQPFFLSKYEMTQGQWQRSPAANKNPSYYKKGFRGRGMKAAVDDRHPVEQVSWTMTRNLLNRLGLALPSEDQWEYAARAGSSSIWVGGVTKAADISVWGNIAALETKGLFTASETSYRDDYIVHAPVGQFSLNAFGLFDVLGNLWEWTSTGIGSSNRVTRGGSFSNTAMLARVAHRYYHPEEQRYNNLGLRSFCQVSFD